MTSSDANCRSRRLWGASGSALALALSASGAASAGSAPQPPPAAGPIQPVAVAQLDTAGSSARFGGGSPSEVEGVVVTAERRSTNIEKTPVAITAISSESLDKSFINELSGLNAIVPSLEITRTSGFENLVTIRGVGSETPENDLTTTPGVSEFVDGVYVANTISLDQTLFDVDHIEVLRGPQGDLYGESSIGGAINIVTRQPELGRFGGSGDFSFGDYALSRERAEINIPVYDTVAVRASFQKYDHQGFTKDTYFPDFRLDDAHDVSGKVAVLWKPSSNFSATLTGQWYHSNQNGAAQKNINDPDHDPRELYQDYPGKLELTNQLYHLNIQYDLPWFSIRSITAYQTLSNILQEDSSRSAYPILGSFDDVAAYNTSLQNYNEEFDILSRPGSALEWIVGAFALDQRSRQFIAEFKGSTPDPDTNPSVLNVAPDIETNPPATLGYGNDSDVWRQGYAAFGRATYHLLPNLRISVGARINHDAYTDHSYNFSAFGVGVAPSHFYSDTVPTGRVEADYDATRDNLVYASVSRGYKPGGVNGISGAVVVPFTFNNETNTAFEVGSKNYLMDRTLRLNLAAYYYVYRNFQYIENDPVPFDGGMANIPSVHEYGFEAEGTYVSADHRLRINGDLAVENGFVEGSYSTIDSTVQNAIENTAAPCQYGGAFYNPACWAAVIAASRNIGGKTPPAMPKLSGAIDASYVFDLAWGTLTPRIQYVYRGSEWARIFNEPGLDRLDPYGVTNLNLEYIPTNSRFRLSISATNAFNVNGVNSRYTDPYGTGQTSQEYIPPRQVIAMIAYSF